MFPNVMYLVGTWNSSIILLGSIWSDQQESNAFHYRWEHLALNLRVHAKTPLDKGGVRENMSYRLTHGTLVCSCLISYHGQHCLRQWLDACLISYHTSHFNEVERGILVSPCPSVGLWTESCLLCIFNNTHWIHFIFAYLIKQLQKIGLV